MKLKWTRRALKQLVDAQSYIAMDNPAAARQIAQHIADATTLLLNQPEIGRPGRIAGTREWVVKQTPYLLAYALQDGVLQILAVIHSKQSWPDHLH